MKKHFNECFPKKIPPGEEALISFIIKSPSISFFIEFSVEFRKTPVHFVKYHNHDVILRIAYASLDRALLMQLHMRPHKIQQHYP